MDDVVRTRIKSVLDGSVPPQLQAREAKKDKIFVVTASPNVEIEARGRKGLNKLVFLLGHSNFLGVKRQDKGGDGK